MQFQKRNWQKFTISRFRLLGVYDLVLLTPIRASQIHGNIKEVEFSLLRK